MNAVPFRPIRAPVSRTSAHNSAMSSRLILCFGECRHSSSASSTRLRDLAPLIQLRLGLSGSVPRHAGELASHRRSDAGKRLTPRQRDVLVGHAPQDNHVDDRKKIEQPKECILLPPNAVRFESLVLCMPCREHAFWWWRCS